MQVMLLCFQQALFTTWLKSGYPEMQKKVIRLHLADVVLSFSSLNIVSASWRENQLGGD